MTPPHLPPPLRAFSMSPIRALWRWQLFCWVPFLLFLQILFGTFFPLWTQRLPITLAFVAILAVWTTAIESVYRAVWPPASNSQTNFGRTVLFSLVACLPVSGILMAVSPHLYRAVGTEAELIRSLCFVQSARISSYLFWFGVPFVWCLARFFFLEWAERLRQEREAARTLIEAQHRELSLLRSQLNVHFLFNALNSLIAYADYDPSTLKTLVHAMADYLRFCLEAQGEKAPLQREIDAVSNYLKIEQHRHLDALIYEVDCSPEAAKALAPIPILQPLIENALRYGIKTAPRPLRLRVSARLEDGHLHAEVANTGKWIAEGKSDSTGVGLANLRRKLDLLYPDRARLSHEKDNADGWIRARIVLPAE